MLVGVRIQRSFERRPWHAVRRFSDYVVNHWLGHLCDAKINISTIDMAPEDPGVALVRAAAEGLTNVVKLILKAFPALDVNVLRQAALLYEDWFPDESYNQESQFDREWGMGCTPLHIASCKGHVAVVVVLLTAKGVDVNVVGRFDKTALHWACERGHASVVDALLAAKGVDISGLGSCSQTALYYASLNGQVAVVEALLAASTIYDIDFNAQTGGGGYTALQIASGRGDTKMVSALLAGKGINVNAVNYEGHTALHYASIAAHASVVSALLAAKGIDSNVLDFEGHTALHMVYKGHIYLFGNRDTKDAQRRVVRALLAHQGVTGQGARLLARGKLSLNFVPKVWSRFKLFFRRLV